MYPFLLQPQVWELMLPLGVRAMDCSEGRDLCGPKALSVLGCVGSILQLPEGCCQDGDKPRWGWRARLPGPCTPGSPHPQRGCLSLRRAVGFCSLFLLHPCLVFPEPLSGVPLPRAGWYPLHLTGEETAWQMEGGRFRLHAHGRVCSHRRVLPGCLAAPQNCDGVSSFFPPRDL